MPNMTTSSFARVTLLTLVALTGGCGNSTIADPFEGKGCKVDSDCGTHGICIQQICVVNLTNLELAVTTVDFAKDPGLNPDFAGTIGTGGDMAGACPPGTKRC